MVSQQRIERRQHPRKVVNIEAYLSCRSEASQAKTVLVHDISLKGMAIQVNDLPLKVGDRLCLCLSGDKVNCGQEHVIETTVVNLHDSLAGLQFDSVGIHVLKDLQQLLRKERAF